jgi:hypothetical protein
MLSRRVQKRIDSENGRLREMRRRMRQKRRCERLSRRAENDRDAKARLPGYHKLFE